MPEWRPAPAGGRRPALAFLLAALLVETVFFVVLGPLLPHYASALHLSKLGAGVLNAAYAAGCGVAALPAGLLARRIGVAPVTIAGLVLVGGACGAFAIVSGAAALDAARVVQGVGGAAVWAGSIAWLMAIGGDAERGRLIGFAFAAGGIGSCVGPALGALAQDVGTRSVFLALAGAIILLAGCGAAIAGRPSGARRAAADKTTAGVRAALSSRATWRALALVSLPSAGYGVAGVLVPLQLHALGASAAAIAAVYVLASLLEAVVSPLVGGLYDGRGAVLVLRATLLGSTACAVAFALQPPLWGLLATVALSWPVIGAVWVPALAELTAAAERIGAGSGLALGLFNLCWAVSQSLAGIGGAQLARGWEAAPFVLLACVYGSAALAARRLAPA